MEFDYNFAIIVFFSMLTGAIIFNILSVYADDFKPKVLLSEDNNNCSNNSNLINTSNCLKDELQEFYKYNDTNAGVTLSIEELKIVGGVCSHYAQWYNEKLIELGFNSKTEIIRTNNRAHEFTIAWSDDLSQYCLLDQLNIKCIRMAI